MATTDSTTAMPMMPAIMTTEDKSKILRELTVNKYDNENHSL